MSAVRIAAILVLALAAGPYLGPFAFGPSNAAAADRQPRSCLNKAEQRAALAAGRAIPLAQVRAKLDPAGRKGKHGDIIGARLCETPQGLVYVLTLLARNGKVSRVTVDAASGAVVRGR